MKMNMNMKRKAEGIKEEDMLTFVAVVVGGGGRSTFIYTHRLDFESIE